MFLAMVEPMASPASPDNLIQSTEYDLLHLLVDLDPHNLLHLLVPPLLQALNAFVQGPAGHPQEDGPCVLQLLEAQVEQEAVPEGGVGQGHVDVPWGVHQQAVEFAEGGEVQSMQG